MQSNDQIKEVPLSEVEELKDLKDFVLKGYKGLLAVPCRFYRDPDAPDKGRSIYAGKLDLLDDLDQSLSQRSQTSRVSTPVEYFDPEILQTGKNGRPLLPKVYNRQFIQKASIPDGDGRLDTSVQTTQPTLNFEQYTQEQKAILDFILIGYMSPASFGIDVARKDNALSQREKQVQTTMTRDTILDSQIAIEKKLISLILDLKDYMDTGVVPLTKRNVSVKYPGFANPSFESMAETLLPLWSAGAISDEEYVDRLYGDDMSEEDKAREIAKLKENRERDNLKEGDFDGIEAGSDLSGEGTTGEGIPQVGL